MGKISANSAATSLMCVNARVGAPSSVSGMRPGQESGPSTLSDVIRRMTYGHTAGRGYSCRSGLLGFLIYLFAAASVLVPGHGHAQDGDIISLQLENDLFGGGTDRHFTHGTRASYLSSRQGEDSLPTRVARWLPCLKCRGDVRYGIAIGQSMFTPSDITQTALIVDDRPFAGWAFGTLSLVRGPVQPLFRELGKDNRRSRRFLSQIDSIESFELTLGVVGPSSYAEQTQKSVHDTFGARNPNGWDNQLKDEPGIILSYETRWRSPFLSVVEDFGIDVLPSFGVSLGNVFTFAAASLTLRLGDDLSNDFGPPRIRPSLPGSEYYAPNDKFGWYIFVGAGGRAVARNIFLDGNTYADSHRVDKRVFVFDLQVGLVLSLWGRARLSFTNIFRTREFHGQNRGDEFGAISLSFRF